MKKTLSKQRSLLLMLLAFFALTITSCVDEDIIPEIEEEQQQNDPDTTTPQFGNADGSLWAVKSYSTTSTPIGNIDVQIGLGVASFFGDDEALVDGGNVSLNGEDLSQASNNSYFYQIGAENFEGISFTNGVSWSVSGSGIVPSFDRNVTFAFPECQAISSGATVSLSNGYTLTVNGVSDADSVLFMVGDVIKTMPGNSTSATFSSEELSSLESGTSVAQVAAYAYMSETIAGKEIYFGKQAVRSITVQLED
ncbi:hypothetical protein [Halocola ammonii]